MVIVEDLTGLVLSIVILVLVLGVVVFLVGTEGSGAKVADSWVWVMGTVGVACGEVDGMLELGIMVVGGVLMGFDFGRMRTEILSGSPGRGRS